MRLDGTGEQELIVDGYVGAGVTDWSPDSRQILFFARTEGHNRDLYTISSDGGTASQLTSREATDFHGRWSPDGTEIVFYSNHGDSYDLWLISASGGGLQRLMSSPSSYDRIMPRWSPDGQQIAFRQYLPDGRSDISIFDRNTEQAHRLTETEWSGISPGHWSEDGSLLYAVSSDIDRSMRYIWAFSIPDGDGTLLLDLQGTDLRTGYSLTSDGERLYFPLFEETCDIWVKR
jgi:TolB protein